MNNILSGQCTWPLWRSFPHLCYFRPAINRDLRIAPKGIARISLQQKTRFLRRKSLTIFSSASQFVIVKTELKIFRIISVDSILVSYTYNPQYW